MIAFAARRNTVKIRALVSAKQAKKKNCPRAEITAPHAGEDSKDACRKG